MHKQDEQHTSILHPLTQAPILINQQTKNDLIADIVNYQTKILQFKQMNNLMSLAQYLVAKKDTNSRIFLPHRISNGKVMPLVEQQLQQKSDLDEDPRIRLNPNSKYPLEHAWSFWFFKNNRDSEWKDNLILLTTVSTVEDFWSVFTHLRPISDLQEGRDYMLFKEGIQPMWEDEENVSGGRWLVNIDRRQRSLVLDSLWLQVLLSLIGSHYDNETSSVNGVVGQLRFKCDKIALWTKSYNRKVGQRFRRVLDANEESIIFEYHEKFDRKQMSIIKSNDTSQTSTLSTKSSNDSNVDDSSQENI